MRVFIVISILISNLFAFDFNFNLNWFKYIRCRYFDSNCQNIRVDCLKRVDEIDTKDFTIFVKGVENIYGDLVIFVEFRSKNSDVDIDLSKSTITIEDSRGRKKSLNGCNIPNFRIYEGEAKLFPFVFRKGVSKLKAPYTLKLDIYNVGLVILSDLKVGEKSIEY